MFGKKAKKCTRTSTHDYGKWSEPFNVEYVDVDMYEDGIYKHNRLTQIKTCVDCGYVDSRTVLCGLPIDGTEYPTLTNERSEIDNKGDKIC